MFNYQKERMCDIFTHAVHFYRMQDKHLAYLVQWDLEDYVACHNIFFNTIKKYK